MKEEQSDRQKIERLQEECWRELFKGTENPCSFAFIQKYCVSVGDTPPLSSLLLLVIDGFVYDATLFAPTHKAGLKIIQKNVGKLNCGEVFHRIHGAGAHAQLETLRIGALVGAPAAAGSTLTVPSVAQKMKPISTSASKKKGFVVFETSNVSHNTKRITFASPNRLELLPGGHVMVSSPTVKRSYTPFEINATTFSILVKRYEGGHGSGYLHGVRGGEFVEMSDPIEPEVDAEALTRFKSIVLVAGGTGVAPIYSVAKHLLAVSGGPHVFLFACFRDEHEVLLGQQLEDLQDEFPSKLDLHFVFSRQDLSHYHNRVAFHGRFNPRHLENVVQWADGAVVCGPPSFGDDAVRTLSTKLSMPTSAISVL